MSRGSSIEVKKLYQKKTDSFLKQFDITVFMGSMEVETCKYISDKLGVTAYKHEIKKKNSIKPVFKIKTQPLMTISQLTSLDIDKCIVMIKGLNPMMLYKLDFTKHPRFNQTGYVDDKYKMTDDMWLDYRRQFVGTPDTHTKKIQNLSDKAQVVNDKQNILTLQAQVDKAGTDIQDILLTEYCCDDACQESSKKLCMQKARVPYSPDYKQYGKNMNLYTCDNVDCIKHPKHQINLSDLARFLKLKNPGAVSKKDVLHTVIEIIENQNTD